MKMTGSAMTSRRMMGRKRTCMKEIRMKRTCLKKNCMKKTCMKIIAIIWMVQVFTGLAAGSLIAVAGTGSADLSKIAGDNLTVPTNSLLQEIIISKDTWKITPLDGNTITGETGTAVFNTQVKQSYKIENSGTASGMICVEDKTISVPNVAIGTFVDEDGLKKSLAPIQEELHMLDVQLGDGN